MDEFGWIITGLGVIMGIAGVICSIALPFLILGGVGYLIYKRSQQGKALREAAQAWRSTTGTVLMSSVQTGRHRGSDYPVVVYQYEVHGRRYQSQIIKAGEQFLNIRIAGQAQETVNRYPIGMTVTVYYNPDNPVESALER
jgi:hypothetical protein